MKEILAKLVEGKDLTKEEAMKAQEDEQEQMKLFSKVLRWHSLNNL